MGKMLVKTLNGLKEITSDGDKAFNIVNVGGVFEERVTFNKPATLSELKELNRYHLPSDYYEFLKITNGLSLFEDKYEGITLGGAVCQVYSIETVLKNKALFDESWVPILYLRDLGTMFINDERFQQHQNYLSYPGIEADKYFKYSFSDWLVHFIGCNGNQFWAL